MDGSLEEKTIEAPKLKIRPTRPQLILVACLVVCLGIIGIESLILFYRIPRQVAPSENLLPSYPASQPVPKSPETKATTKVDLVRVGPEAYQSSEYFAIKGTLRQIASISGLLKDSGFVHKTSPIEYFEAGTYQTGPLAGYKRILVVVPMEGMGVYYYSHFFATLDDKEYLHLDSSNELLTDERIEKMTSTDYDFGFSVIDFSKVKKVAVMPPTVPEKLTLNSAFKLTRRNVVVQTDSVNKNGEYTYFPIAIPNLASFQPLKSPSQDYRLYSKDYDSRLPDAKKKAIMDRYVTSETNIYSVDSTGLMSLYELSWNGDQKNLDFSGSDLQTSGQKFNKYSRVYFSGGGCGGVGFTAVASDAITSELEKVGTIYWQDAFAIKDKTNQLLWLAWMAKFENKNILGTEGDGLNKDLTLEQYQARTPLIFFKDYWGRWIVVGENDYYLIGGCAKPVIYFYPQKPTKIMATFVGEMVFDVTIPTYKDFWQVLAEPNGSLTDLQPEKTDCHKLNLGFGSEYAREACLKNQYPYLYWAGQGYTSPYPEVKSAWYLPRPEVQKFLKNKLSELGLNANEVGDFMEYWGPKLMSHREPYFRLAFLTATEMNKIAPMVISPAPQTVYRLFLDFKPLSELPQNPLPEPKITPLVRDGFTVVEWGGLK